MCVKRENDFEKDMDIFQKYVSMNYLSHVILFGRGYIKWKSRNYGFTKVRTL